MPRTKERIQKENKEIKEGIRKCSLTEATEYKETLAFARAVLIPFLR